MNKILELRSRIQFAEEDLKEKSIGLWFLTVNSIGLFVYCFLTKRPGPIMALTMFTSGATIICVLVQLRRVLRINENKRRYKQLIAENAELLLIEESPILRKIGEDYLLNKGAKI